MGGARCVWRRGPHVGLAAHGLGAQRGGEAVDLPAGAERRKRGGERIEQLDPQRGVLLRPDALALVAVVVHARLVVGLGEDGRALAEVDEVALGRRRVGGGLFPPAEEEGGRRAVRTFLSWWNCQRTKES